LVVFLTVWCGCPVSQSQDFPAPIRQEHTLGTQRDYFLYVPSTYDPDKRWPLVVTCHGTRPYDDARPQAKEWAALAEGRGFIVAAPKLEGVSGDDVWFRTPGKQIELQLEDEAVILEIVSRVKAAYNVADEQVFLTGWSAGGYAVLFTGLRNPDVFRALAIRQGNFDERYLSPVMPRLNRYQPILVLFGATDVLLKSHAEKSIQWLRSHGMDVHRREITGGHRRRPDIAYGFFRKQAREPWVRVDAVRGYDGEPLAIQVRARCRPTATACYWWFGDGGTGRGAAAVHAYAQSGTYTVTMQAVMPGGGKVLRKIEVTVPTVQVGVETKPPT
jgi:poly(3-hydroxybutyrate) depolymerase